MASAVRVWCRCLETGSSDYRSPTPVFWSGGVAQLGERLLCKQEVIGSIPFTSTRHLHHAKARGERTAGQRGSGTISSPEGQLDRRWRVLMDNCEEASCVTEAGNRGRPKKPCQGIPHKVSSERRVCRIHGSCRWVWRSSANQGHLVDALALRGDEGRGTLRKARGRCERSLIPGSPNGATHPARGILR